MNERDSLRSCIDTCDSMLLHTHTSYQYKNTLLLILCCSGFTPTPNKTYRVKQCTYICEATGLKVLAGKTTNS